MERATRKQLDWQIERLNIHLDRPIASYVQTDGKWVCQIGNFHLQHQLGGWQVQEMVNEGGGVSCPFGHYRLTGGEMLRQLCAINAAVEIALKAATERAGV
jgi:hypothetical protein